MPKRRATGPKYRIRGLEWKDERDREKRFITRSTATPIRGMEYTIEDRFNGEHVRWGFDNDDRGTYWMDCSSVEEGKKAATMHWIATLTPALVPAFRTPKVPVLATPPPPKPPDLEDYETFHPRMPPPSKCPSCNDTVGVCECY